MKIEARYLTEHTFTEFGFVKSIHRGMRFITIVFEDEFGAEIEMEFTRKCGVKAYDY